MKHRIIKRKQNEWTRRVSYYVWCESNNARWRAIRRARKEQGKALSRMIRRMKNYGY